MLKGCFTIKRECFLLIDQDAKTKAYASSSTPLRQDAKLGLSVPCGEVEKVEKSVMDKQNRVLPDTLTYILSPGSAGNRHSQAEIRSLPCFVEARDMAGPEPGQGGW